MPELRAIAYARVSSKEQAEKELSIPAQLKAIRKYCQDKGWKLVGEYLDEGKSAKTADRPAFQKMIAIAKKQNRHFDIIVVHKFDRFSRSREDHVIFKGLLKKHGVTVHSVSEQTDPETPHGFLLEGMLEVISEFYNMNLATETKKGMVENAKRGFHNGGSAPYGYRNHRFEHNGTIKSTWVISSDEEVANIQRIFHLYAYEGMGYKKIASLFNSEQIPGPKGKPWSYTTIWHILHNEAYIGNRVWNKQDYNTPGKKYKPEDQWIRTPNAHPAIVSQEVFDLVKEKAAEKNISSSSFRTTGSPFILRGLLYCPKCGGKMVSTQSGSRKTGKKYVHRYYVCGNYKRKGKTVCSYHAYPKEAMEKAVIDTIVRELLILSLPGNLEEAVKKYQEDQQRDAINMLQKLETDIKVRSSHIDLLKADPTLLSSIDITEHIRTLEKEISSMLVKKSDLEADISIITPDQRMIETIIHNIKYHAEQLTWATPEVKYELIKQYIDRIDIIGENNLLRIVFQLHDYRDTINVLLAKNFTISYETAT